MNSPLCPESGYGLSRQGCHMFFLLSLEDTCPAPPPPSSSPASAQLLSIFSRTLKPRPRARGALSSQL